MSTNETTGGALTAHPPTGLSSALSIAHKAAQLLTSAARANLEAVPDDSHSNLGWDTDNQRFLSHPLPAAAGPLRVGLSLSPLTICLVDDGGDGDALSLDGPSYADALRWLDERLADHDLKPASGVTLSYDLPAEAAAVAVFEPGPAAGQLSSLAAWFDLAAKVLAAFAGSHEKLEPGPAIGTPAVSSVRLRRRMKF